MTHKGEYRLADSTAAEPLINSFAVWSDTISPAPYSLHLLHYQIKTLSSYIANPEIHIKAVQNPKFIGGPFIDVPASRANEVKEILDRTEKDQKDNVEFAKAITEFYEYLAKEAKGQSLEPYYEKIPDPLRGYVELLYDYYSHPIVRLMESLLYESPYYKKELQSVRLFHQPGDNFRRPFVSTPRLQESDQIDWAVPFDSPDIDELFKVDVTPRPLGYLSELLGLDAEGQERLLPLLSQDPNPPAEKWLGPGVRVRYFGHACVLVEWNGISVLSDPWLGVLSDKRDVERFSYKDLPEKIDFVIITHGHHDHFVPESLLRLRHRIECLVVPRTFGMFYADTSLKLMAKKLGFKNVIEPEVLESIKLPDGEIIAIPFFGEHSDLAHGKSGYIIRAGKEKIMLAADSNCLDKKIYEHVRKAVGPIETVFLGMECVGAPLSWLYGALMPSKLPRNYDMTRRTKGCDSKAAHDLLEAIGGKRVYIYAMGCEPWYQYSMGLGLSEDSTQLKEASRVVAQAREEGFIDAQRPFGKFETYIQTD
ncbi:MAG TPA: MBL fold metallo-hydrolase [Blastocatellia bacterium]|nr:MBL fold metallo-hydrolase [Blastocatellia bacterium]